MTSEGRPATVAELIVMMNRRVDVTARFATGDEAAFLSALGAEGSHMRLAGGTSVILLQKGVASRWTAFHEWLHRCRQQRAGAVAPGEDRQIESFLRCHRRFLRLDE